MTDAAAQTARDRAELIRESAANAAIPAGMALPPDDPVTDVAPTPASRNWLRVAASSGCSRASPARFGLPSGRENTARAPGLAASAPPCPGTTKAAATIPSMTARTSASCESGRSRVSSLPTFPG